MKTIRSVKQTALRGWNHSVCLIIFGLRSRIKNISKIKQSNLFEHFLRPLKFFAISHGSFPCCSLTWLPITDHLCSSTR